MRNNRTAGHGWELRVIKDLKELGYKASSSRLESRLLDSQGIDIVSDFPLKIQCKTSINQPNVHDILTEKQCDVIFFRKQEKATKNFVTKGEYAMMRLDKLYEIIGKCQSK